MSSESLLDALLEEHHSGNKPSGPSVVRVQNDEQKINWERGAADACEMNGQTGVAAGLSRAKLAKIDGQIACIYTADTDAWHELGTVMSGEMTAKQLFDACPAIDFTLHKERVAVKINGVYYKVPKLNAVMRTTKQGTVSPLPGVGVGDTQELINPREALNFLDEIIGKAKANYVSAGVTHEGRKIFIAANMPGHFEPVPGDKIFSTIMLTDAYDQTERVRWTACEQRPVCHNTRRLALLTGQPFHSFKHTASMKEKMNEATNALRDSMRTWKKNKEVLTQMVATESKIEHYASDVLDCVLDITAAEVKQGAGALAAALDVTQAERDLAEKKFSRRIAKRENILEEILERHESERNTAPGTLYGNYNTMTEWANHGQSYRGSDRKRKESRLNSVLFGKADSINQAAYSTAFDSMSSRA